MCGRLEGPRAVINHKHGLFYFCDVVRRSDRHHYAGASGVSRPNITSGNAANETATRPGNTWTAC